MTRKTGVKIPRFVLLYTTHQKSNLDELDELNVCSKNEVIKLKRQGTEINI